MAVTIALEDIVSWYRSKQRLLAGTDVTVVDVAERREHLPAALAELQGVDALGRINGWVSGEFDFEAVRVSTGDDLFWRHAKVESVEALEPTFDDFVNSLRGCRSSSAS